MGFPGGKAWSYNKPTTGWQLDSGYCSDVNLLGSWPFSEAGGSQIYGNPSAVMPEGPYQFTGTVTWSPGQFGPALTFDGTTGYIVTSNFADALTNLTVGCWFKSTMALSSGGNGGLINKTSPINGAGWGLFLNESATASQRTVVLAVQDGVNEVAKGQSSLTVTDGFWHFVCFSMAGGPQGTILGVVDWRVLTLTNFGSGTVGSYSNSASVILGAQDTVPEGFLNGSMDMPFVLGRALTYEEMFAIYLNPFKFFQPMKRRGGIDALFPDSSQDIAYRSQTAISVP